MSRLGLVCLSLVLIGLAAETYIAAKLGMRRGEVEDQLRGAISDSEKAVIAHSKTKEDLKESQHKLASAKLGWGFEWNFPAGGNVGSVQRRNDRLAVTGLGTAQGLIATEVTDAAGQKRLVQPVVHVFTDNGQGQSLYIGEFLALIGPNELTEQNSVLVPTWFVSPEELEGWNFTGSVRLRSQIPAGGRAAIDDLYQTIQETFSQLGQTRLRIEEQTRLTEAASTSLADRKKELLGDPTAELNTDHPEYKLGLLEALVEIEEERNSIQAAVDHLRRLIKSATEMREGLHQTLKQVASDLRDSGTRVSQRAE